MFNFGNFVFALLLPISTFAYAPFSVLSTNYQPEQKSQLIFNKIPPFISQDGLGNCFSATTAAYIDMLNCKAEDKDPNKNNCASIKDSDSLSRLATGKYAGFKKDGSKNADYSGLLPEVGANATNALKNIIYDKLCPPTQKCASLDKALTNFNESTEYSAAKAAIFKKLEDKHTELKKGCADCSVTLTGQDADEIKNLTATLELRSNVDVLKAFTDSSYSEFLEKILMPQSCNKKAADYRCYDGPENVSVEQFPLNNSKPGKESRDITLSKVKEVLKTNTPVILNAICTKTSGSCEKNDPALHTLIITGYRKVCGPSGCKDSLRVYNSYGSTWQSQHNDGWLDADSLLDSTNYNAGTLTWVQEGKSKLNASL